MITNFKIQINCHLIFLSCAKHICFAAYTTTLINEVQKYFEEILLLRGKKLKFKKVIGAFRKGKRKFLPNV